MDELPGERKRPNPSFLSAIGMQTMLKENLERRCQIILIEKRYGQRNKVQTVFSFMKRRFGDEIKSRLYRSQVKELKLKCIVYSVDRFLKKQRIFITDQGFNKAGILIKPPIILEISPVLYPHG
jgi:hypothetical protein